MAKKAKKKAPTKRAPSVQQTLVDLCGMVNRLSQKVAELQLEIAALRNTPPLVKIVPAPPPITWPNVPQPDGTNPWGPTWKPPYEVTCESKGLPPGLMHNRQRMGRGTFEKKER